MFARLNVAYFIHLNKSLLVRLRKDYWVYMYVTAVFVLCLSFDEKSSLVIIEGMCEVAAFPFDGDLCY